MSMKYLNILKYLAGYLFVKSLSLLKLIINLILAS